MRWPFASSWELPGTLAPAFFFTDELAARSKWSCSQRLASVMWLSASLLSCGLGTGVASDRMTPINECLSQNVIAFDWLELVPATTQWRSAAGKWSAAAQERPPQGAALSF